MSGDNISNVTSSPSPSSMIPLSSTTAMTSSSTVSNILYVWIPSTLFLISIFVVLAVSFIRHTKRVLRKRRALMDYHEANVLSKRPRICRMFSSSVKTKTSFLPGWSHPSTLPQSRFDFPSADMTRTLNNQPLGNAQFLSVPALDQVGSSRHDIGIGLEDAGQSSWYQSGLLYGHRNMAFSFEEDLGRSHVKRVRSPQLRPLPGSSGVFYGAQNSMLTNGFMPQMEVIDSESESELSVPMCGSKHSSSGPQSVTLASNANRTDGNADNYTYAVEVPAKPSITDEILVTSWKSAPGTCSHCGSVLPVYGNSTSITGTRPKKKPKYKRQSACSDSFELKSRPEHSRPGRSVSEEDTRSSSQPRDSTESSESLALSEYCERSLSSRNDKNASEAANVTTMTLGVKTTPAVISRTLHNAKPVSGSSSNSEQMAKGLEVYTIQASCHDLRQEAGIQKTSFPESGERQRETMDKDSQNSGTRSTTTGGSPRRTETIYLPSTTGRSGSDQDPHKPLPPLPPSSPPPKPTLLSAQTSKVSSVETANTSVSRTSSRSSAERTSTTIASANSASSGRDGLSPESTPKLTPTTSEAATDGPIFWLSSNCDVQQTLV